MPSNDLMSLRHYGAGVRCGSLDSPGPSLATGTAPCLSGGLALSTACFCAGERLMSGTGQTLYWQDARGHVRRDASQ
jgi:hypothetical protein